MRMINAEEAKKRSGTYKDAWTRKDEWQYRWCRLKIKLMIKKAIRQGETHITFLVEKYDSVIVRALESWLNMYGYETQFTFSIVNYLKISWEGKCNK